MLGKFPPISPLTPLYSQDIPEELSEQIPSSSQHDIPTEMSEAPGTSPISKDAVTPVTASPISEDLVTPVTEEVREEPVTPDVRRGVAVDDTPGRDADVETEFETSPEKGRSPPRVPSCLFSLLFMIICLRFFAS